MRKSAIPALSLFAACLLALSGCGPSSNKASAPTPSVPTPSSPAAKVQPSSSGSPMKPGLWELKMESDQMKQMQMPKISPEQAAQMRKMGIKVPEQSGGGMVMKVCYTKEMLAEREVPAAQNDDECKPSKMSRSGNSFSGQVICNGSNMKGTGTVQGTMTDTQYQLTNSFDGTMGGEKVKHTSKISGTFLGADCGDVKPLKH